MRSWTKEELLTEAHDHGFDLTKRTFTNWVQKGLLANATREGRGPGAGVGSVWPDSQRRLLLKLLDEHSPTNRLASLAAIPVGMWLYFGDSYVDTKQTMKAMRTWADGVGKVSRRKAAAPARELAEQLAGPDLDPRVRNNFVRLVQDFSPYPETFEHEAFKKALQALVNEATTDLELNVEGLTMMIEARLRATRHIDRFTRADYIAARAVIHATLAEYQTQVGEQAPDFDLGERFRRSPMDLATQLGVIGLRRY